MTEVGSRLVGTEGDKKSIIWAVDKMRALGFDKVWTEEVSGTYWHRGDVEARRGEVEGAEPTEVEVLPQPVEIARGALHSGKHG